MPALEYTKLDQSTKKIRLPQFVELHFHDPDANTAPMHYRLDTYDHDDCPSSVALSYAWGDMHPRREISPNGEMFLVRSNQHSVLPVLREDLLKHGRYLDDTYWIDVICINQQDRAEATKSM